MGSGARARDRRLRKMPFSTDQEKISVDLGSFVADESELETVGGANSEEDADETAILPGPSDCVTDACGNA
jgi:hypothetical protein